MATTVDDLTVRLIIESGDSQKKLKTVDDGIKKVGKTAGESSKDLLGLMDSLQEAAVAALGLNAAIDLGEKAFGFLEGAIEAVLHPINESIDAYKSYASQVTKLGNALKVQGAYSEEAVNHFKDLADELEHTTVLSEEQTLKMAALGKAIRLPDAQIEKMIKNSVGLAYVMGGSVDDAFNSQLQSLKGNARAIAAYDIRLKDLTETQARSGKGIDLLAQKFGAFGELQVKGLGGTLIQIKNITEKIFKEIGEVFYTIFDIKGQALFKKEVLEQVLHFVQEIKPQLMDLANSIRSMIDKIKEAFLSVDWKDLAKSVGILTVALIAFNAAVMAIEFSQAIAAIGGLGAAFSAMGGMTGIMSQIGNFFKGSAFLQGAKAMAIAAAEFIATAVAIMAVAAAIDIVVRNFNHLEDIAIVVGGAFKILFQSILRGLTGLVVGMNLGLQSIAESIAGTFLDVGGVATKAAENFGKSALKGAEEIDKINEGLYKTADAVQEAGKTIDTGFAGQAVSFFKKLLGDSAEKAKDISDDTKNIADNMDLVVKASEKFLDLMKQLKTENIGLRQQIAGIGKDQVDQIKLALEYDLQRLKVRREDIALKFADNAAELKALNDQLNIQETLTKQLAAAKIGELITTLRPAWEFLVSAFDKGAEILKDGGKGLGKSVIDIFNKAKGMVTDLAKPGGAKQAGSNILGQMKEGAKYIGNAILDADIGGIMVSALEGAGDVLKTVFSPDKINAFAEYIQSIEQLPDAILKAFDHLDRVFDRFVDKFPAALERLLDKLPGIIQKILDKLPQIIKALIDGLAKFIDMLPGIFQKIFDALPGLIAQLAKALPGIILKLFDALGSIIAQFIKALPDMLKELMEYLPSVIEAIIEGLLSAMGDIIGAFINEFLLGGGLEKIVGAFLRMIPRLVVAIVQGILRGLARGLGTIFGGLKVKMPGEDFVDKMKDGMKKITDTATGVTDQMFKLIEIGAAGRAKSIGDDIRDAVVNATEYMRDVFTGLFDKLIAAWRWIYDNILKPIIEMFRAIFQFFGDLWMNVFKPIVDKLVDGLQAVWEFIKTLIDKLVDGLQAVWAFAKDLIDKLVDGLGNLWTGVIKPMIDKMVDEFQKVWDGAKILIDKLVDGLKDVWEKVIKPIVDKLSAAGKGIWDSLKDNLDKASDTLKGYGTKIWDGLKAGLDKAADTFKGFGTNIWDSLKTGLGNVGDTIKTQLDKINPSNLFKKIFNFDDTSGTGKVEDVLGINVPYVNFASGSASVAGDSILNDKILAMLSPGEAVIPRSMMSDPYIKAIVQSILSGNKMVPRFAYGAKDLKKDLGGGGGGGGGIGGAFGDLASAGKSGFEGLGDLGQDGIDALSGFLGDLDPSKLWDKVMDKVGEGIMSMFSSNRFADGGVVGASPSPAQMPTFRPAMASAATPSGGSMTFNITMNIHTTQKVDGDELYRKFKSNLMRDSNDGQKIIDVKGIRK